MHNINDLLALGAEENLANRGYTLDREHLVALYAKRKDLTTKLDELRQTKNRIAKARTTDRDAARKVKVSVKDLEAQLKEVQVELGRLLYTIPNFVAENTPTGLTENDYVVTRTTGEPNFVHQTDHTEIGEKLGVLDFKTAVKMSGARFSMLTGKGAVLERALTNYLLDKNTQTGYIECSVPTIVTEEAMFNSGQLPKFEEDLFRTQGTPGMYLIPTGEVPLVNTVAGSKLLEDQLPYAVTAQTQCFRAEAGAHGKDTRGLIRQHEFSKVELVKVVKPETAEDELEAMVAHVETLLQELGLVYRVIALPAGDLGFSSMFTYDIEVWFPSQEKYREISSVSNFGQFQARRAGIKVPNGKGGWTYGATLNGSALPLGRTIAAILEQHYRFGRVKIPEALQSYCHFKEID